MRLLLDTHIFLLLIHDNRRLSDMYRQEIYDLNNELFLSVVSIWECVIKYQIGKLNFTSSPEIYLPLQRREHLIKTLTVDENSIAQLIHLPLRHRDPFDRLIISQGLQYDLTIMTQNKAIIAYPEIKTLPSN
ncbi:MAG: type II toxin-antitoxin system VapC family toxin [Xenococcus sp. (in: cyanobacteria)]